MSYQYTQIDKMQQLGAVRNRIRDLEAQHLTVYLRVNSPDLNAPVNEQDRNNLLVLETSLDQLHTMEESLSSSIQSQAGESATQGSTQ